jgi:hypothetical protein
MKAHRRAKAQQAYPSSKQAPMQELPLYEVLPYVLDVLERVKAKAASLVDCSSNPSLPMKLFQLGVFMSELAMELIMTFSTASTVRKPNGLISQTMLGTLLP